MNTADIEVYTYTERQAARFLATHLGGLPEYWFYYLRANVSHGPETSKRAEIRSCWVHGHNRVRTMYQDIDLWEFIKKRDPNALTKTMKPSSREHDIRCFAKARAKLPEGGALQVYLYMNADFAKRSFLTPEQALKLAKELKEAANLCVGRRFETSSWEFVEDAGRTRAGARRPKVDKELKALLESLEKPRAAKKRAGGVAA